MFEVTKKDINNALDRTKVSLTYMPITEEILNRYVKQATSQIFDLAQNMAFIRDVNKYGKFNSEFTVYKSSAKPYAAQILGFIEQYSPLIRKAKKNICWAYCIVLSVIKSRISFLTRKSFWYCGI